MNVKKHDGSLQPFDIKKIRDRIEFHAKDLDVNTLELESSINLVFFDGISTKEIQDNLVYTSISFAKDIQSSDWRLLAARLDISDHTKEVVMKRGFAYGDILSLVNSNIDSGLYSSYILDYYLEDEFDYLSNKLKQERDYLFDYAGISSMKTRYLKKGETIQEMFMVVSMILASKDDNRIQKSIDIYEVLSKKEISLATPLLSNLRIDGGNLSSCFITKMDDDINSIYDTIKDMALISKSGGGVGLNVSDIRAKNSSVNGVPNSSGGPVPFIKVVNDTMVAVSQVSANRAGAATIALEVWHMDIEEFIEIQSETGDLRRKAHDIFPQVVVNDVFMEKVEKNEDWYLFDPKEIRDMGYDLTSKYGKHFAMLYHDLVYHARKGKIKLFKKVKARDLIKVIMKSWVETGLPYVFFKDTANEANPLKNNGIIGNANLCVSGDTEITIIERIIGGHTFPNYTEDPHTIKISEFNTIFNQNELMGYEYYVLSYNHNTGKNEYNRVYESLLTNDDAEVFEITDDNSGKTITCTGDHKIWCVNRNTYIEAKHLNENDEILLK